MISTQNYLSGLTLSNNSNTKVNVAAGVAADSTNAVLMNLGSSAATVDFSTTGAGGLDTGSIAASTWYHCFVIMTGSSPSTTTVSTLASTSLTPSLPTNYSFYRRIGSVLTDSNSHLLSFSQNGDEFLWVNAVGDINDNALGSTAKLYTLTVPTGVKLNALFRAYGTAGVAAELLLTSPDETATAVQVPAGNNSVMFTASGIQAGHYNVRTDTSARVRAVASSTLTIQAATYGWIDTRGRFG